MLSFDEQMYLCSPPSSPIICGRRNGHLWIFVFCHSPSLLPIPPLSCPWSQHSILFSVFLFFYVSRVVSRPLSARRHVPVVVCFPGGFMSSICPQACSSGRLRTCPNHFNRISVTLIDMIRFSNCSSCIVIVFIISSRVTPHIHTIDWILRYIKPYLYLLFERTYP